MLYGTGYGAGSGGGWGRGGGGRGLGFRGYSPPWPYVGRGRGGLPRCGYYFAGPAYNLPSYHYASRTPAAINLDGLRSTVSVMKDQLESMRARVSKLEKK